jgi:hypothetical protein
MDNKGKKKLKKIMERHEEACQDLKIENFNDLKVLYYFTMLMAEEFENSLPSGGSSTARAASTNSTNDTLVSTQATPMDLEITQNHEHQSEVVTPESSTKNSNESLEKFPFTPPVTPKVQRTVTFAEMASRNIGASSKRDLSPMPVKLRKKPEVTINKVQNSSQTRQTGTRTNLKSHHTKQIFCYYQIHARTIR